MDQRIISLFICILMEIVWVSDWQIWKNLEICAFSSIFFHLQKMSFILLLIARYSPINILQFSFDWSRIHLFLENFPFLITENERFPYESECFENHSVDSLFILIARLITSHWWAVKFYWSPKKRQLKLWPRANLNGLGIFIFYVFSRKFYYFLWIFDL